MATTPAEHSARQASSTLMDAATSAQVPVPADSWYELRQLHEDCQPASRPPRAGIRKRSLPIPDELALARERRRRQRASVEKFVENRMAAMEFDEMYSVPRLYVVLTGSLASASALQLIETWSEKSFRELGTPWVNATLNTWTHYSGLSDEDWVAAREVLRDFGVIQERRRFDLKRSEIVTEIAFVPEAFAREVAEVREVLRERAWELTRQGTAP
jgi:hypothetical protein